MNCGEAEKVVHAYVDGELAGVDREEYEGHLLRCDGCLRVSRLQARFKAAIRAHLSRPSPPEGLHTRIEAALSAEPVPARWPWQRHPRLVPAAAAAVLLVGVMVTVREGSHIIDLARTIDRSEVPMDVDCAQAATWFRGRVGFPVRTPSLAPAATCQGGRLVNVGPRPAVYLKYRAEDGHRVSFLVLDDEAPVEAPRRRVINGRDVYFGTGPGVSTAAYRDRGLQYVVTSDLDEGALTQLMSAAFSR